MSRLIVLTFPDEGGAQEVLSEVGRLQQQNLIVLEDAATVVRQQDGTPKLKQATSLVGAGPLGGAFWGMLIGLLCFTPLLGGGAAAPRRAIEGTFADAGVDDVLIKQVASSIRPGRWALFLLIREATPDQVIAALAPYHPEIIHTSLGDTLHDEEAP